MIEVFTTNVIGQENANMLIGLIHKTFTGYEANFDLQDCDNILRVKCITGAIHVSGLISLLNDVGFCAEVLPDRRVNDTQLFQKMNGYYAQQNN